MAQCTPNEQRRKAHILKAIYQELLDVYGPQHWWPARTPFEVVVGAVLVQNTNWSNVERVIKALRQARVLSFKGLFALPLKELETLIRPAGYFRIKARRLKNVLAFLGERYKGDLRRMVGIPLDALRAELLCVNGIGPETADSILLYALKRPVFVVDAYTRRMLTRHGFPEGVADYETVRLLFTNCLTEDVGMYNEYHALIVRLGKDFKRDEAAHDPSYPLKAGRFFLG